MDEKDFGKLIIQEKKPTDVIKELTTNEKLPLILWGAGQVASEIKNYFEKLNIIISAAWVDGESKEDSLGEIPILSLEEIKKRYDKFNVILGHSKYDLGEQILNKERQVNKVFYLVSVAYGQYYNFDFAFIKEHLRDYYETFQMLEDEMSRKSMIAYLNTRINNNISYIKQCMTHEQSYFQNDIYCVENNEIYIDVGAFDGDSVKLFLKECSGKYKKIHAFEPDRKNFKNLQRYFENNQTENIELHNIGAWKEKDILYFQEEGQESGVSLSENANEIAVDSLDNILNEVPVSLIKTNYRSGLLETLEGAKNILQRYTPKLAIVVGFDEWLLIKIPQYIKKIVPEYKIYLRYNRCMPACLTMYGIVNKEKI